jgi:thiamine biosynthesis protein ThiS
MSKIKITLNGENYLTQDNQAISDLVKELDLDISKIAIERNLEIILADNFVNTPVQENDKIEIVSFIGGG